MYIDDCVRVTQLVANGESREPVNVVSANWFRSMTWSQSYEDIPKFS